jgi:hypothetical protein
MNWAAVGAIGEVAGAVAVVATLFYLGRQIRQNSDSLNRSNDYARANAIQQANSHYGQVFAELVRDAELASIYQRALAGESLDPTETVRFQAFVNTFFAWLENFFSQTEAELGFVEVEERGSDFIHLIHPYFRQLVETDAGRTWWETDAQSLYSIDFREAVNRALQEGEPERPAV